MTEAIRFSETSVLTSATLRNITEDGILHNIYITEAFIRQITALKTSNLILGSVVRHLRFQQFGAYYTKT
jgi:hypothetical protein